MGQTNSQILNEQHHNTNYKPIYEEQKPVHTGDGFVDWVNDTVYNINHWSGSLSHQTKSNIHDIAGEITDQENKAVNPFGLDDREVTILGVSAAVVAVAVVGAIVLKA